MWTRVIWSVLCISLLSSIGLSQTLEELERKKDLDFQIAIDKSEYLMGEPLWIHCLIKNPTSQPIPAYIPSPTQTDIYIYNSAGDTLCCTEWYHEEILRRKVERVLEPGEEWYFCLYAEADPDPELVPGIYSLRVLYPLDLNYYQDALSEYRKSKNVQIDGFDQFSRHLHEVGDNYSNILPFRVIEPQTQRDKKAYRLLTDALEKKKRRSDNREQFHDAVSDFITQYPDHSYATRLYVVYLNRLQRSGISRDAYFKIEDSVISFFPNTALAYSIIHDRALMVTEEEEREQYFKRISEKYKGQWISKYVQQEDRVFDHAEAQGWSWDKLKEFGNHVH
jgi:hypothetical protein